jgi:hypothetical protein
MAYGGSGTTNYGANASNPPYGSASPGAYGGASKPATTDPKYAFTDDWEAMKTWLSATPAIMDRYRTLLTFKAPDTLISAGNSRLKADSDTIELKTIDTSTGDYINLDYYSVEFTVEESSGLDAFLNSFRLGLNSYLKANVWKKDDRMFIPHSTAEEKLWSSAKPTGAIIDIIPGWHGIAFDDLTVILSDYCSQKSLGAYWIFSTLWSSWNHYHPVSGNRLFGMEQPDSKINKFVFYISGADGLTDTDGPDFLYDVFVSRFKAGDKFWRTLFTNLETWWKNSDPQAKFNKPIRATADKKKVDEFFKTNVFSQ